MNCTYDNGKCSILNRTCIIRDGYENYCLLFVENKKKDEIDEAFFDGDTCKLHEIVKLKQTKDDLNPCNGCPNWDGKECEIKKIIGKKDEKKEKKVV